LNKYQAPTRFVGKNSKYIPTCPSTNSLGFEEALSADLPEGFAWVAGHQTAGKGQRGNQWIAEPNQNLLVSFLLKPGHEALPVQFYLSKAIALGIVKGLNGWSQMKFGEILPLSIKWPNDIYLAGKKLGGILIESNFQAGQWAFSIIGIGLNINQTEFPDLRATSLKKYLQDPQAIAIEEIYQAISQGIETQYQQFQEKQFAALDLAYHAHLFQHFEEALYQDSTGTFRGKIIEVNDQGLLCLERNNEHKWYDLKELCFIFKEI
jgi:BirA family biotin operon repressor/biotin-[acetyl-CoA-carboxylase] ligase